MSHEAYAVNKQSVCSSQTSSHAKDATVQMPFFVCLTLPLYGLLLTSCMYLTFLFQCRTPSSAPRMVYLSPVTKNRSSSGPLQTPSPKGRAPISIFGLAQTPGMPGLMSGFPGTPVSDAMTAASWLHDMSLRHPQQVWLKCFCTLCRGLS